jgi:site-specific DNA recombinase
LERQLSRDHAEVTRLAAEPDHNGIASARLVELHTRIASGELELKRLVSTITKLEQEAIGGTEIAEALLDFDSVWEAMRSRERSKLIQLLVSKVEFDPADTSLSISFYPDSIRSLQAKQREGAA